MNEAGRNNYNATAYGHLGRKAISRGVSSLNWSITSRKIKTDPSNLILTTEISAPESSSSNRRLGGGDWGGGAYVESPYVQSGSTNFMPPFHRGAWNYVFCDGHVDTLKPLETLSNPQTYLTAIAGGVAGTIEKAADGMWLRAPLADLQAEANTY
ncbi:MAG: hypothetical protein WCP55_17370 [Lentisphaerota bacterium]